MPPLALDCNLSYKANFRLLQSTAQVLQQFYENSSFSDWSIIANSTSHKISFTAKSRFFDVVLVTQHVDVIS